VSGPRGTILAKADSIGLRSRTMRLLLWLAFALVVSPCGARAQPADAVALLASQVEAMRTLAMLDGVWRGEATVTQAEGRRITFVQTERIGPFLGGSITVIEGRGYDDAGGVRFNALGIVSFDPATRAYTMHSHALGRVGDFAFVPTGDGYRWEIPLASGRIRYVATVGADELHEVGDLVLEGREPVRIFEMRLKRIGSTDWPAAGAAGPK
jgi:hypothetical protein